RGMRIAIAGSAAPESLVRKFDQFGAQMFQLWGLTETTPAATVSRLKRGMESLPEDEKYAIRTRQGLPLPFVEMRARSEGKEVSWDGEALGEIELRGPWVAGSYFQLPDYAEKWTSDGWFRTGDVVTIDPEGYVKIADRSKDLIKSGGEWISSVDVENALMGHPAIKEAAVVAVPHEKWSERPVACGVLKDGAKASDEELRAWLEPRLAKFWLPDGFV